MNNREKILTWSTMGLLAAGMVYVVFFKIIIEPISANRKNTTQVIADTFEKILDVEKESTMLNQLRRAQAKSFGSTDNDTWSRSRSFLISAIRKTRIRPDNVVYTPLRGSKIKGGREIGWMVNAEGNTASLIDLLYLLQNDDHIHQLKNVSWSTIPNETNLKLKFNYITLMLDDIPEDSAFVSTSNMQTIVSANTNMLSQIGMKQAAKKLSSSTIQAVLVNAQSKRDTKLAVLDLPSLRDGSRKHYDLIASRDIFRPYMKRPPKPVTPPKPPVVQEKPKVEPPVDPYKGMRLVGLSTWQGSEEITILNSESESTRVYAIGDDLLSGEIMLVDYRPLTHPNNPLLKSPSRLIVRIKSKYYAIELGQMLTDRRLFSEKYWPAELVKINAAINPAASENNKITKTSLSNSSSK